MFQVGYRYFRISLDLEISAQIIIWNSVWSCIWCEKQSTWKRRMSCDITINEEKSVLKIDINSIGMNVRDMIEIFNGMLIGNVAITLETEKVTNR